MELTVAYGGLSIEQNNHIRELVDRSPKNVKAKCIGDKVTRTGLRQLLKDATVVSVFLNEKDFINLNTLFEDDRLTMCSEADSIFEEKFGVELKTTPSLSDEEEEDVEIQDDIVDEEEEHQPQPQSVDVVDTEDGWNDIFTKFDEVDETYNEPVENTGVLHETPVAVASPIGVVEKVFTQPIQDLPKHTDEEYEMVESKLKGLERLNVELRKQLQDLKDKFSDAIAFEEFLKVKKEKSNLEERITQLNQTIVTLESDKRMLDSKLLVKKEDIAKLDGKINSLNTMVDSLNQEIENLNAEITRLGDSNLKLSDTNKKLEKEVEQVSQKLSLTEIEFDSNKNLVSTLQSENRNLQSRNASLLEDNEKLIETNKQISADHQSLLHRMKEQLAEAEAEPKTEPITVYKQEVKPLRRKYPNVTFIVPLSNLTVVDTYKYMKSVKGNKLLIDLTNNSYMDYVYQKDFKIKGGTTPTKWLLDGKPYGNCFMQKTGGEDVEIISYMIQPKPDNLFKKIDWDKILSDVSREQQVFIYLGSITEEGVVNVLKAVQGMVNILGVLGESSYDQRSAFMYLKQLDSYKVLAKHGTKDKAKIGITERW
ncbi:hypothetical protein ACQUY5_23750 [Bacillus cereus]|uniref:hypothetical protein n=1 Tax=Bacillus cereus TaxID=1396 RepID=UPI003D1791CA